MLPVQSHERGIGMRHPKHIVLLTAVGLFVLVGAASATLPHPQTADVSAAFSATQTRMHTRTCTEDGNTFRITNAAWRGTATSTEPRLSGMVNITTRTVLNETTGDGWATGTWRTRDATANPRTRAKSDARLSAVIDNGNHLDGLATGNVRRPAGRLLGNWSATIIGDTISGELGANAPVSPDNSALIYRGGCP
jgi:hypothetical protein